MTRSIARRVSLLCIAAGLSLAGPAARAGDDVPLRFQTMDGHTLNAFYRHGPVAAHLLLRSGTDPRILVAFPAGNSGVGLWFADLERSVNWTLAKPLEAIIETDGFGRPLRGVRAELLVDAPTLEVRQALLSSVRVLRDYETGAVAPAEVATAPVITGQQVSWSRHRLDGAPGYRMSLELLHGRLHGSGEAVRITAGREGRIRFRLVALTGETPLAPLATPALLNDLADPDTRARNALAFLSYEEKFLAGSWRFNTYFGRDTLMSLHLLMPALRPTAIESGLRSVFERLAPNGEVAHEEDIGEFAVLRHRRDSGRTSDAPIYDYGMIDDDFMLAPVAAAYLLDQPDGRRRAAALLAQKLADGTSIGEALLRNSLYVIAQSRPFAADPRAVNLIRLKPGRATGQWRDSQEGLGRGHYPYDINAVFVPAALRDIDRLGSSGLLDPYVSADQRRALASAAANAAIWAASAPAYFIVRVPSATARANVRDYAATIGVNDRTALAGVGNRLVEFNALALDEAARPVRVVHSDDGFSFLFGEPSPAALERSLTAMMRPFPAGLMTDIGLFVANPAFADDRTRDALSRKAYHGTVVWAWQQAVLIAGLERQMARRDLPPALENRLSAARCAVSAAVSRTSAMRTSELWSWSFDEGGFRVAPFGTRGTDEDESNAAQLWSTVFLAFAEDDPTLRGACAAL